MTELGLSLSPGVHSPALYGQVALEEKAVRIARGGNANVWPQRPMTSVALLARKCSFGQLSTSVRCRRFSAVRGGSGPLLRCFFVVAPVADADEHVCIGLNLLMDLVEAAM